MHVKVEKQAASQAGRQAESKLAGGQTDKRTNERTNEQTGGWLYWLCSRLTATVTYVTEASRYRWFKHEATRPLPSVCAAPASYFCLRLHPFPPPLRPPLAPPLLLLPRIVSSHSFSWSTYRLPHCRKPTSRPFCVTRRWSAILEIITSQSHATAGLLPEHSFLLLFVASHPTISPCTIAFQKHSGTRVTCPTNAWRPAAPRCGRFANEREISSNREAL